MTTYKTAMNPPIQRMVRAVAVIIGAALLAGCVHSPPSDPWDPVEPVNRAVFKFNRKADKYVLKPVATGYKKITPTPVRSVVGNFFANASEPVTIVNSALQLKFGKFNVALGRFMINTVAGVGGLFDVASRVGVAKPDEDLGQTFGYWGLGRGPYLVLPLLGPSDGRDAIGRLGDHWLYPLTYLDEAGDNYEYLGYGLRALDIVDTRARYLGYEQMLTNQFDPYIFLRGYYLNNRYSAVHDGDNPKNDSGNDTMPGGDSGNDGG